MRMLFDAPYPGPKRVAFCEPIQNFSSTFFKDMGSAGQILREGEEVLRNHQKIDLLISI